MLKPEMKTSSIINSEFMTLSVFDEIRCIVNSNVFCAVDHFLVAFRLLLKRLKTAFSPSQGQLPLNRSSFSSLAKAQPLVR